MGIYVNPGNIKFKEDISSEIYVDKTMLLALLNSRIGTRDKYLCVSRPRRFGKTMAERMMAAYYSKGCDSRGLFKDFKISSDVSFAAHLNKYNVLHIDINRFWSQYGRNAIGMLHRIVRKDFAETFPDLKFDDWEIPNCVMEVYRRSGIPFVIMLDEYDVFFRDEQVPQGVAQDYLKFLNVLFKSDDMSEGIALSYITGILPIIRDKAQSKLNNFEEITFLNPGRFVQFTGFTEEEVRSLCRKHGMDFIECRNWYDGYNVKGVGIYAPKSVVCAMSNGEFRPYWNQTSQYEAILDPIKADFDGMRSDIESMVSGGEIDADTSSFMNTPDKLKCKDDVFTYLCHLGYLAYDSDTGRCRIPNREVRGEWANALAMSGDYQFVARMIQDSKKLLKATWNGDGKAVADALSKTHEHLTSPLSYNNEKSFQSAIRLAFFYADCYYTIISECPSGKGYADLAFIPYKPDIPAMVVELKISDSAQTALDQIRRKQYFSGLDKYAGNLLLVGVSYDRNSKKHSCVIEKG